MRCSVCGKEHDLLEPAFRRPDIIFALSPEEREARANEDDDMCRLGPGAGEPEGYRYFLRAVLPVRLVDAADSTAWGLWVELSEADILRVRELWTDPRQADEPPFSAVIANHVPGYPETLGLPVRVQLQDPPRRAELSFEPGTAHSFAAECEAGVSGHKVVDWLRTMGVEC